MNLIRVTQPAVEPILDDDVLLQLRIDTSDDTHLIAQYIRAVRERFESIYDLSLITQTWDWVMESWPAKFVVPRGPLQSVTSIKYNDAAGAQQTVATSVYAVDAQNNPGEIVLKKDQSWPSDELYVVPAITVRFISGYGDDGTDVPQPIRQAMLLAVAELYEFREPVIDKAGQTLVEIPTTPHKMMMDYRRFAF